VSYWKSEVIEMTPGQSIRCVGVIAEDLEVFKDHFPDFPVLPGVLALDILRECVSLCESADRGDSKNLLPLSLLEAVKFQHFLRPGERWEGRADKVSPGSKSFWKVQLSVQDRIAVSARMCFNHDVLVREV